jgi:hypothetical protein
MVDSEVKNALRKLAEGRHPEFNWPLTASHSTLVYYVGILGRKSAVQGRVIHPPRVGDHIRWMKFSKGDARCRITYYEVVQVQWDVRDARHYHMYIPGSEAEGYLTVFVKPVKGSPGELFDRAELAADRKKERRRRERAAAGRARNT